MAYLIDIDGTLMNASVVNEGAAEFIKDINSDGTRYLLMTNSIKRLDVQKNRLRSVGIGVKDNCIINPIVAINRYLEGKGIERARIIGTQDEIAQVNVEYAESDAEIVILLDFEKGDKGYRDLQGILDEMEKGVEVITASISPYYFKDGSKTIDTGAFVGLLENVSGKRIINFGKPAKAYFDIAASMLKEELKSIYVIGDDWSTDIKGANDWGAKSILVKSGKYNSGDEDKESPSILINSLIDMKRTHRTIAST